MALTLPYPSPDPPVSGPAASTVAWQLAGDLDRPASAFYDDASKHLYVANRGGYLSKVAADGKPTAMKWVTGLADPTGVRGFKTTLYVACIEAVAVIDVPSGTVTKTIPIPGAKRLNDVAIDGAGVVYVSDTVTGQIFAVAGDAVSVFADGAEIEKPNGLLVIGNQLFVAGAGDAVVGGRLFALNLKTKQKQLITPTPLGHLDGLERDRDFHFLVSDGVAGKVYRVSPRGEAVALLEHILGAGDHAYITDKRYLVVPRTTTGTLTAYDLSKAK